VLDLQARLTQRFALLGRQEQRKVVAMLEHEIGPAAQDPRTFLRERPPPTRVGVSRGLDRPSRLAGAHARDLRQLFACGWVEDRETRAGVALDPLSADEAPVEHEGALRHDLR